MKINLRCRRDDKTDSFVFSDRGGQEFCRVPMTQIVGACDGPESLARLLASGFCESYCTIEGKIVNVK